MSDWYASLKAFSPAMVFPCVIIVKEKGTIPGMVELVTEYGIPLLRTERRDSERLQAHLILYLNVGTGTPYKKHGVLVEVWQRGVNAG